MSNTKSNQQSPEHSGSPTQSEQPKGAGNLPVNEMDDATRQRLEQEALDAGIQDPNRNLDKAELDKPAYGGGH